MRCFYLFRSGPVSQLVIRLHVVTLRIKGNLGINARRAQYSMVAAIRYFMIPSNQKIRENRIALLASLEKKSCWDRLNESYFVHKIMDPPNFRGFDWNIENGNISNGSGCLLVSSWSNHSWNVLQSSSSCNTDLTSTRRKTLANRLLRAPIY